MKKQFKTESKKLLDLMINSIYTHKEIFLRELISNASDAEDKLYFRSLTDENVALKREDYEIRIDLDKENRLLTISDNGIGMTAAELEKNLGTIAKSGSSEFKSENDQSPDVSVIGQFGVGFYSAFMVADDVRVCSLAYGETQAYEWRSKGADGFTVTPCDKDTVGTEVILHIKPDTDEEDYSSFLEEYKLRELVRKYSDYIHYPIVTDVETTQKNEDGEETTVTEKQTLNSMVPLWKRPKGEVTDEEFADFYKQKFYDYEAPAKTISYKTEGTATFSALLFIPSHAPYNYYSKEYERGLKLYSNGVLIMDSCKELLPDCFSFVKGIVDSDDVSLNISRETLQHDSQLKLIAKNVEKKIRSELEKMLKNERAEYEKFFKAFGLQIKFGVQSDFGMHAKDLENLLMFRSSETGEMTTLGEYVSRLKEDDKVIYYACSDSVAKIEALPQIDALKSKGKEVLYCTEYVDEFALKTMREFDGHEFVNACTVSDDLTEDEKTEQEKLNADYAEVAKAVKDALGDSVAEVRFSSRLGKHPVTISTQGEISLEMERVLSSMPGADEMGGVKAQSVLEINADHAIAGKLKAVYALTPEKIADYAKVLYAQARLVGGFSVEDPAEAAELVCDIISR
ncbi:MAG: molecular chaperone HtpG [Clostridia bacterium]|nr:molecular chaperone HtpG [Clostridia bacterium]